MPPLLDMVFKQDLISKEKPDTVITETASETSIHCDTKLAIDQ